MGASLARTCRLGLALVWVTTAVTWAQPLSAPSNTQCKQWDDAFVGAFEAGFWACLAVSLLLGLFIGFLGRLFWLAAAPRIRILVATCLVFSAIAVAIVALPWMMGFGWLWFSGVGEGYFDCQDRNFGAKGLFGGLVGAGVAALAQWPALLGLLALAAIAGGLLAWGISEGLARGTGLRKKAKGEAAA
jgi:hypothetical protein